jgi:predicted acyltransferase
MDDASEPRLPSIDLLRGFTIAAMIFVNNPGDWNHVYPPFAHADWDGCTPDDFIFPFFLFIVGTAGLLSLRRRHNRGVRSSVLARQAFLRGATIVLVGWAIAAFPFTLHDFETLRIPGVLPRIGLVYIVGTWILISLVEVRWVPIVIIVLLGIHTFLLTGLGYPLTPEENFQLVVDKAFLGEHMWPDGADPEGIVSTLSATATMLSGTLAGYVLARRWTPGRKVSWLVACGALSVLGGILWSHTLPINKHLWTGSYVLVTSGAAAIMLAASLLLTETFGRRAFAPLLTFGKNPLAAFVMSEVLARTLHVVRWHQASGKSISLRTFVFRSAFGWIHPSALASHVYALAIVCLWYVVLRRFEARGWYWKV